jgi:hypothetical protein
MAYFVINKERLIHHLDYDNQKSARGVLNWWVEDREGTNLLSIALHIQGVDYLYRQLFTDKEEVVVEIRNQLTKNNAVLGYRSIEEISPKQTGRVEANNEPVIGKGLQYGA